MEKDNQSILVSILYKFILERNSIPSPDHIIHFAKQLGFLDLPKLQFICIRKSLTK